jgi:hypothetical protein
MPVNRTLKIVPVFRRYWFWTERYQQARRCGWACYRSGWPYIKWVEGYQYFIGDVQVSAPPPGQWPLDGPLIPDYTKPIQEIPGRYLDWPGKAEGKPKPPIIWLRNDP